MTSSPRDARPSRRTDHDVVVVGAGSAGCVLAHRLSEDPTVRVCLVEAGPEDTSADIALPTAFPRLFRSEVDWDYDTVPERGLDGRRLPLPRGRVLGGTSAINAQIYVRGHRSDFDDWGLPGWGYDDLLPLFLRSEDNERGPGIHHGTGGPMAVADGRSEDPACAALLAAALEAGHSANPDPNGPEQDGFGWFQVTQRGGRRETSATAFLHPVRHRPNLTVETHLRVDRVLLAGGRVRGVLARRLGERVEVRADHVVLAAGAYNSPALLMHSGIGPADVLTGLGLPVVVDNPAVGRGLQDHLHIPLVFGHDAHTRVTGPHTADEIERYRREGRGPLASNGPEVGGFARTRPGLSAPDVQYMGAPWMTVDGGLGMPPGAGLSFGPTPLQPRSRGTVRITSPDPTTAPRIDHAYLTDPEDVEVAVAGLRGALAILGQPALAAYTTRPFQPPASTAATDLAAYARRQAHSTYHPVGTCALGTVLDEQARVLGVEGLRVADASVLPTITRGNTHAPVVVIAEKVAELMTKGVGRRAAAGNAGDERGQPPG